MRSRLLRIVAVALVLWASQFAGMVLRGCVIQTEEPLCEEVTCD